MYDNDPRLLRIEANAMLWLDNDANWQAWEIELTGRETKAKVAAWVSNGLVTARAILGR